MAWSVGNWEASFTSQPSPVQFGCGRGKGGKGDRGRSGGCTATSRNKIDGDLPQHRWTMRVQQASEPQQIAQPHDTQARRCSLPGAKVLIEMGDGRERRGRRGRRGCGCLSRWTSIPRDADAFPFPPGRDGMQASMRRVTHMIKAGKPRFELSIQASSFFRLAASSELPGCQDGACPFCSALLCKDGISSSNKERMSTPPRHLAGLHGSDAPGLPLPRQWHRYLTGQCRDIFRGSAPIREHDELPKKKGIWGGA
ncbi:hypothetical protein B0T11DRAFT_70645 [Plectosphaerella cucumerina]|uniref:Uncharacterized protein n=1 Tax=Plectosphaerella cucumerina TaxID=40658 RepID=A0A8K0X8K8_9PEZI|nr:hypothetical protein B0T11DRAFT_70645 [Plectosphaerella cucumerina]